MKYELCWRKLRWFLSFLLHFFGIFFPIFLAFFVLFDLFGCGRSISRNSFWSLRFGNPHSNSGLLNRSTLGGCLPLWGWRGEGACPSIVCQAKSRLKSGNIFKLFRRNNSFRLNSVHSPRRRPLQLELGGEYRLLCSARNADGRRPAAAAVMLGGGCRRRLSGGDLRGD